MDYDAAGRQLSQTTSNLFDAAGRTLASVDAAGLVTAYQYPDELPTVTITPGGLLTSHQRPCAIQQLKTERRASV